MRTWVHVAALATVLATTGWSRAEQPTGTPEGAKHEVLRDPNNVKGISPYEEQLAEGRKRFAAHEHDAAIAAFTKAAGLAPDRAKAYLLLAQTQLAKGAADAALAAVETGRGKSDEEAVQAKLLMVRADLLERKASSTPDDGSKNLAEVLAGAWEKAKEGWSAYSVFLTAHSRLPDHTGSADKRKAAIDARRKREADYAPVKARMDAKK